MADYDQTQEADETIRESRDEVDGGSDVHRRLRLGEIRIDGDGRRFVTGPLLGKGATGVVHRVQDQTLDRAIALKSIDPGIQGDSRRRERFLREARITAGLEHAGVVPVYDIGVSEDGGLFLAMREIKGQTLAEAMAAARADGDPDRLLSPNRIVTLFLRLAETLAHAHAHAVVHRDIKPQNIMLGTFGEVFLLDWGSAASGEVQAGMVGTPLYMSPEQARGEAATIQSDLYSLGCCLFEMLVGRTPIANTGDAEAFWRQKRAGVIDEAQAGERRAVPHRLLAIAYKAIAADPAQRYESIAALATDLEAFQAGQAVAAYHENPVERLQRLLWHHRRGAMIVGSFLLILGLAGWLVLRERLKEWATWGQPVLVEDFSDAAWERRWQIVEGAAVVDDGALVTTSPGAFIAFHRPIISGPVAIEFTGRIRAGALPCDLSVVWCDRLAGIDRASPEHPMLLLKIGANDNLKAALVLHEGGNERFLAQRALSLEHERDYRVRAELEDSLVRLSLDGQVLFEHHLATPLGSGHVGLFGWYAGKAFDDIQIQRRDPPQRVTPLVVGDGFMREGLFARAARHYEVVAAAHEETDLGIEARFRAGRAWSQAGDAAAAGDQWRLLPAGSRAARLVEALRLEADLRAGRADPPAVLAMIEDLSASPEPRLRQAAVSLWMIGIQDTYRIDPYLDLHRRCLPDDPSVRLTAATRLLDTERIEEAMAVYPEQPQVRWRYLFGVGRCEEAVAMANSAHMSASYLVHLGRFAEVERRWSEVQYAMNEVRILQGRFAELEGGFDDWYSRQAEALILQGHLAEAQARVGPDGEWPYGLVLGHLEPGPTGPPTSEPRYYDLRGYLAAGYVEQLLERGWADETQWHLLAALEALAADDTTALRRHRQQAEAKPFHFTSDAWFAWFIGRPLMTWMIDGDADACRERLRQIADQHPDNWAGRLAHACRFIAGDEDEASVLAQPASFMAGNMLPLLRGLRADLAGDVPAALAAYRDYLDRPSWRRCFSSVEREVFAERLAEVRRSALHVVEEKH